MCGGGWKFAVHSVVRQSCSVSSDQPNYDIDWTMSNELTMPPQLATKRLWSKRRAQPSEPYENQQPDFCCRNVRVAMSFATLVRFFSFAHFTQDNPVTLRKIFPRELKNRDGISTAYLAVLHERNIYDIPFHRITFRRQSLLRVCIGTLVFEQLSVSSKSYQMIAQLMARILLGAGFCGWYARQITNRIIPNRKWFPLHWGHSLPFIPNRSWPENGDLERNWTHWPDQQQLISHLAKLITANSKRKKFCIQIVTTSSQLWFFWGWLWNVVSAAAFAKPMSWRFGVVIMVCKKSYAYINW